MKSLVDRILSLYRNLTRALPEDFQQRHGPEMVRTTEDMVQHMARGRGPRGLIPVVFRVFGDLFWRIPIEHAAEFRQDAGHGLRVLLRSPGFTFACVLSLAIGIGSLVSLFSIVELMFLRQVPEVRDPRSLVTLMAPISYPDYEHIRDNSGMFSGVAAYIAPVPFRLDAESKSHRVWGHIVSPNYFDVLGAGTQLGRVFGQDETGLLISRRLWQTRFAEDPGIVGRTVRVNGRPLTILGVTKGNFTGAVPLMASADLWISTHAEGGIAPELNLEILRKREADAFNIVGRLKPEIAPAEAQSALDAILKQRDVQANNPNSPAAAETKGRRVRLAPGGRLIPIPDESRPGMLAVYATIGGLLLWVVCSNIGTLLLARGGPRRKEIAIRMSMGASRSRIVRQMITESFLLASMGGVTGWLLAAWSNSTTEWFRPMIPGYVNMEFRLEWTAVLFTIVVVGASAFLFGLAPALQAARGDVLPGLKSAGELFESRKYRWFSSRNLLVLQQIAGSLMLVLLTGFVALGFQRSSSLDLGFNPDNIHMISIDPVRDGYTTEDAAKLLSELPERLKRIPGVQEATIASSSPIAFFTEDVDIKVGENAGSMRVERVGAGFLATVGLPVLKGRGFDRTDERLNAHVAIINEAMAARHWPAEDVIGREFEIDAKRYTVIGLTRNSRSAGIIQPSRPGAFLPMQQVDIARPSTSGVTVLVRTVPAFDPSSALRREIESMDPELSVFNAKPLNDEVAQIMYAMRITTLTYAGIGVFGLILAAVGLAGLTAYTVAQRTKEIGIRMALGARRHDVLALVLKEGAVLVLAGTVIGHASAWAATLAIGNWMEAMSELTETSASDPLLIIGAPVLLGSLTMISCYLPARRAARIDPLVSLRQE